MKKVILFFIFVFTYSVSFCQTIFSLKSQLSNLKNSYQNVLQQEMLKEKFNDQIKYINSKANYLVADLEKFVKQNNTLEAKDLLEEAEAFSTFTNKQPTCNCLHYFNKFIAEFGGISTLLKEQNGIKIYSVKLGNFWFLYAYAKNNQLYNISISLSKKTNSKYNSSSNSSEFGLNNEVEVFFIHENTENWNISNVTVGIISTNVGHSTSRCKDIFPRL